MLLQILALIIGTISLVFLQRKHRAIWQELFCLRQQNASLRNDIVNVRKQNVISSVGDSVRLPPLMTSQYGEDVLLWKFFHGKRDGFYIEVGAYDGVGFSNTYFFEAIGWSGILIEPTPEFYDRCVVSRPYSRILNVVIGDGVTPEMRFSIAEGSSGIGTLSYAGDNSAQLERIKREGGTVTTTRIPAYSLNEILKAHQGPIDFISIDVEGSEMDVLRGFDLGKFRPRVLVIEDNSNGADARAREWLFGCDYEERFRCEHNVFYTHKTEAETFGW